jgi:PAS domain S-box-containing protein
MQDSPFFTHPVVHKWGAIRIAGLYLLLGSAWILFSDKLTEILTGDLAGFTTFSLLKGWVFVILTAVLLYWLINRYTNNLRRAEVQLRRVLDALPSVVAYVDSEERCLFSNQAYETWFGPSYRKINGRSLQQLLGKTIYSQAAPYLEKVPLGESITWAMELTNPQIPPRFVEITLIPDLNDEGYAQGFFALITDISQRKQAEKTLRESEMRYRLLAENITDVIWVLDMETQQFRYVTPSITQLRGLTVAEALAETSVEALTPASVNYLAQALPERIAEFGQGKNKAYTDELEQRHKDGSTIWVEMKSRFVVNEENGRLEVYGTSRDITERKKTEGALRESNERFRQIAETIDHVFWMTAMPERQVLYVSPAFERLWGQTAVSLYQNEAVWLETIHPHDRASVQAVHERWLAAPDTETYTAEYRLIHPDGQIRWILDRGTALHDDDGQVYRLIGVAQDITARRRAEEEIRRLNAELEQRVQRRTAELRDLYNNAPCGYHSLDERGVFLLVNDTEANWLRYAREELIGRVCFRELLTPESQVTFNEHFPRFKETGLVQDLEFDMVRKDGTILPVLLSATAVHDENGRFVMSRSTITDHTERRRTEQAMRQSQAQLQAANQELEAFTYSVSHDLRAPLRAINGYTAILAEMYESLFDEEGRRICTVIRSETQRMSQLIDDLLGLSRLGRSPMKKVLLDMNQLVADVITATTVMPPTTAVQFDVAPLLPTTGDPTLLRQVWHNLLHNAVKFSAKQAHPLVQIGSRQEGDETIYWIRDNGAGFDPRYSKKLFAPFQRLHNEREFPGTGVGLAIVQRIILRHGGRVWAESELGQGASFFFALP